MDHALNYTQVQSSTNVNNGLQNRNRTNYCYSNGNDNKCHNFSKKQQQQQGPFNGL